MAGSGLADRERPIEHHRKPPIIEMKRLTIGDGKHESAAIDFSEAEVNLVVKIGTDERDIGNGFRTMIDDGQGEYDGLAGLDAGGLGA